MATLAPPTWSCIALLLASGLAPLRVAAAEARVAPPQVSPVPRGTDAPSEAGGPAQPRLTIASDSSCPSGPAVAEALAALVPPAEWPSGTIRIEAAADTLVVDLTSDGSTKRELQATADCSLRANTVALIIATWTGELASDAVGDLVLRGHRPRGETPVGTAPVKTTPLPTVVVPVNQRELGVGALLSVSGGFAPGVRIDFVTTRAPKGLGWQVGLTLPAQRERNAGSVTASWTRASLNVAVNGRIPLGRFIFSAVAGLAGAYTFASGQGVTVYQGQEALTGGLVVGARAALPWRRLRIWTEVTAYQWLFPQAIAVDSPAGDRVATGALPSFDFQWAVGVGYLLL
jgi:hypothetical protein